LGEEGGKVPFQVKIKNKQQRKGTWIIIKITFFSGLYNMLLTTGVVMVMVMI
jgi:hypothetical protein